MHSAGAARESADVLAAGATAVGEEEKSVYVEGLKDLLKTLFIVSRTRVAYPNESSPQTMSM